MTSPDLALAVVGLFGILYCWEKALCAKHAVSDDQRRMELFRLRDKLHELVLSGKISDTSTDYKNTARFLHSTIKIHKEADFLLLCAAIVQFVKATEDEMKKYPLPKHREAQQIITEAAVLLLEAIASNSFMVRFLARVWPKKLKYDGGLIHRYKPVRAYESLDRFNQSLSAA